ncbi:ABC transporter substrate-binding protein [Falsiroseomonas bella]|uniref:ABC transporter substrate-binding protein n=1 Tax=Falsiroseomonas bella TaxID=2184016 RepID=A0A317FEH0_9PROT|nr:TRAP transporter substrate-binding protein [Falsiroseomonas bella]PWS37450.1 ABC transporter substrate-binding protein [Falsiroseomonas bella]
MAAAGWLALGPGPAAAETPIQIEVVGGLASVVQYTRYEEPFWTRRVPEITGGRLRADIAPFDRRGIRGQEMLPLMRLGVVPFGSVLLGLAAAEEPELNAMDLPGASPDIETLRATVARWRPHLEALLRERYGVELLAVFTYPAQVVWCRQAFSGLTELSGRRVRTSSVGQSELVTALGGTPVVIPFAEVVAAVRSGVVNCAITGTLSGNAIGLHEVATHVSRQAISWGLSVFGANLDAWEALPEAVREPLRAGIVELEREIWTAAGEETEDGLACNAGLPSCRQGRPGRMAVVEPSAADEALRRDLLARTVVPSWIRRCGPACAEAWGRIGAGAPGIAAVRSE